MSAESSTMRTRIAVELAYHVSLAPAQRSDKATAGLGKISQVQVEIGLTLACLKGRCLALCFRQFALPCPGL